MNNKEIKISKKKREKKNEKVLGAEERSAFICASRSVAVQMVEKQRASPGVTSKMMT